MFKFIVSILISISSTIAFFGLFSFLVELAQHMLKKYSNQQLAIYTGVSIIITIVLYVLEDMGNEKED